jgi:hypothetical protein
MQPFTLSPLDTTVPVDNTLSPLDTTGTEGLAPLDTTGPDGAEGGSEEEPGFAEIAGVDTGSEGGEELGTGSE